VRKFGPNSNLDVPDENHTKGLLTESKKLKFKSWINLPHIAAQLTLHNMLLSMMEFNSQIDKSTQTIKDRSTPLKIKCLNDVIQP
jgi:hypothetical protein